MERQLKEKSYYKFGFEYYGPFVQSFNEWILKECELRKIENILFASRDAFCYYKCFEECYKNKKIKAKYIKISKKSLAFPLMGTSLNDSSIVKVLFTNRLFQIEEFLAQVGLDEERSRDIVSEIPQLCNKMFERNNRNDIKVLSEIINRIRRKYDAEITEQYRLLLKYLSQLGFYGKIALVDVGWKGSCQYILDTIISQAGIDINLYGLYLGIISNHPINAKGFLFDSKHNKNEMRILSGVGIIEMIGMERTGTVLGYKLENGDVHFITREYEYYDYDACCYTREHIDIGEIQQGAIDFIRGNIYLCEVISPNKLLKFVSVPTNNSISLFGEWQCYNCVLRPIIYFNSKTNYLFKIKQFKLDLNKSQWKVGFIYRVVKNGNISYVIYVLLKRIFK